MTARNAGGPATTFGWDGANRLQSVLLAGSTAPVTHLYRQDGLRHQCTAATGSEVTLWDAASGGSLAPLGWHGVGGNGSAPLGELFIQHPQQGQLIRSTGHTRATVTCDRTYHQGILSTVEVGSVPLAVPSSTLTRGARAATQVKRGASEFARLRLFSCCPEFQYLID